MKNQVYLNNLLFINPIKMKLFLFLMALLFFTGFVVASHCETPIVDGKPFCGLKDVYYSCKGSYETYCNGDKLVDHFCSCDGVVEGKTSGSSCFGQYLYKNCKDPVLGGTCVTSIKNNIKYAYCDTPITKCTSENDCPKAACNGNDGYYYTCSDTGKCLKNNVNCVAPEICVISYAGKAVCKLSCINNNDCGSPHCSLDYRAIIKPFCVGGFCSKDYITCKDDEVCGSDVSGNPICQKWGSVGALPTILKLK